MKEYQYEDIKNKFAPQKKEELKSFAAESVPPAEETKKRAEKNRRTAIIVVHGMGQQTKFEMLSKFAERLGEVYGKENGDSLPKYDINFIPYENESYLARAETTFVDKEGKNVDVHIFESYWAPITEGKVNFYDVILFFFSSSLDTLKDLFLMKKYYKMLFGKKKYMKPTRYTSVMLFTTLLLLVIVASGVFMLGDIVNTIKSNFIGKSFPEMLDAIKPVFCKLVLYTILAVLIVKVKNFFIQYLGDVCAYISAYKSFKFKEIREQIQSECYKVFKSVYLWKDENTNGKYYDNIIIAGHSLGSLISYDTLNTLFRNEILYNNDKSYYSKIDLDFDTANRTGAYITFGSPLDKIAFNFEHQQEKYNIRDGIVSALQPMISDYNFRPKKWVNIHAGMDLFSGHLDYYDDESIPKDKQIENITDTECREFILAHNQYWDKNLLYKTVLNYI